MTMNKMTMTMRLRCSVLAAVMVLAGCASGVKLDDAAPVETRTPTDVAAGAAVRRAAAVRRSRRSPRST